MTTVKQAKFSQFIRNANVQPVHQLHPLRFKYTHDQSQSEPFEIIRLSLSPVAILTMKRLKPCPLAPLFSQVLLFR